MKKIKVILMIVCLSAAMFVIADDFTRRRVPAIHHPIEYIQPSGDTLMIRLNGDERRHWHTTLDGYLIRENSKGKMCYAYFDKKGRIVLTRRTAHNADDRTKCEQKFVQRHVSNTQNL